LIHSCFDPKKGLYLYYESADDLPLNADLPVPNLPAPTNGVGVPAIVAGRPLPSSAKLVGQGWHARGMVVQCGKGAMGAINFGTSSNATLALVGAALFAVGYYASRQGWFR
jgi:hypothetical protein